LPRRAKLGLSLKVLRLHIKNGFPSVDRSQRGPALHFHGGIGRKVLISPRAHKSGGLGPDNSDDKSGYVRPMCGGLPGDYRIRWES